MNNDNNFIYFFNEKTQLITLIFRGYQKGTKVIK